MASNRVLRALIRFGLDPGSLGQAKRGIKQVEKELGDTGDRADQVRQKGKKAFDDTGRAAKGSAVEIGAVAGATTAVVERMLRLAEVAVKALYDIAAGGVSIQSSFEQAERVFGAAFGDPALGKETLKFLDETAKKLNIDKELAIQFGQSILPKSDDLESFTELLRLTDIQADTTGKTVGELEFAIREALSGDYVSLKDQFDISSAQVDQIKKLTPEIGASAALAKVLGEEFERLGKVNIQGTLQTDAKALQAQFTDLQAALGEPVFQEVKEVVSDLGAVLSERSDDFELMAAAIGDVVANIVDFVGSNLTEFLENLDPEQVIDIANTFFDIVEHVRNLSEILGLVEWPQKFLDGLEWTVDKLDKALTTATQLTALAKAEAAREKARKEKAAELGAPTILGETMVYLPGALSKEGLAEAEAAGQEAYNQVIKDSLGILEESKKRTDDLTEAQEQRRTSQEQTTAADKAAIDAAVKKKAAEQEAQRAEEEYLEAKEKLAEKEAKLEEDSERRKFDIMVDAQRKVMDALDDAAKDREDIARKNVRRLEQIEIDHQQAISDAGTDLSREEQKIARDFGARRIDQAKKTAQKQLDIETEYRRELRNIRQRFEDEVEDAVRNQDAVAFLQAQRRHDQEVEQAQQSRQDKIDDAQVSAQREREALADQERRAVEEAKIANREKLEDLKLRLERELEENQRKLDQELEDQRIAEERKAEQLRQDLERRLTDQRLADQRRQADLETSLSKELEIVQNYEAQRTEMQVKAAEDRAKQLQEIEQSGGTTNYPNDPTYLTPQRRNVGRPNDPTYLTPRHRASGGYADDGTYLLGEQGREFVLSNRTTQLAERLLGGSLTQSNLVSGLAGRGSSSKSTQLNYNPTYYFSERDDAKKIMSDIEDRLDEKLYQLERGY